MVHVGIKPVMHVDNRAAIPVEKARGRRRSIERLAEKAEELGIDLANQTVFISHGDCIGDVRYLEERLHALGVKETLVNYVGPVIGAHSGRVRLPCSLLAARGNCAYVEKDPFVEAPFAGYTRGEEIFNMTSHIVGGALSLAALVRAWRKQPFTRMVTAWSAARFTDSR